MRFDHATPTRIVFGRGRLDEIGAVASEFGKRAIVVTGRSALREHGVTMRLERSLKAAGVESLIYGGISPNPRSDEVDGGIEIVREHGCDIVIGVGGGSAIDAAKAVAVGKVHGRIGPLIGTSLTPCPDVLPIVAVPTTAGTGSEVTKGAIVLDIERNFKSGVRGDDLFPKVALVDPALTATVPRRVALETGFDALTHAIESYIARKANPITETLSVFALKLIGPNLRRVANGDRSSDVLEAMALGALLGGLNVASASTCLPHRLQQAVGSIPGAQMTHAAGLAAVYPAWFSRAYPYAQPKLDEMACLIGVTNGPGAAAQYLDLLGFRPTLAEAGFRRSDIQRFVSKISGNVENDPIEHVGIELFRKIYEESF